MGRQVRHQIIVRLRLFVCFRVFSSNFGIYRRLFSDEEGIFLLFRRGVRLNPTLLAVFFNDVHAFRLLLRIMGFRHGGEGPIGYPYEALYVSDYVEGQFGDFMFIRGVAVGRFGRVDAILVKLVGSSFRDRYFCEVGLEIASGVFRVPLGNVSPVFRMWVVLGHLRLMEVIRQYVCAIHCIMVDHQFPGGLITGIAGYRGLG